MNVWVIGWMLRVLRWGKGCSQGLGLLRGPFRFALTPNTPGAGARFLRVDDHNPQKLLQFEDFTEDKR